MLRIPLLIDAHFHARDFNQQPKGTFETETKAALLSGFGLVLAMPNTDPPLINHSAIVQARKKAEGKIYCDVGFHFGTNGQNLEEFVKVYNLVKGLKVYLNPTTGNLQLDKGSVDRAFLTWPPTTPILVHAEGAGLLKMVLELSSLYRQRLHVCHVSLKEEVEIIRKAKEAGQKVTAEVCPHHCIFTEDNLPKLGPYGKMKPPLGTTKDLEAVWRGIKDGTIDIIATDHAPHAPEEKASENPPFGVIGEGAFQLMWKLFYQVGLSTEDLVRMMSSRPAEIFNIKLDPNSYMEVDENDIFEFTREMIHSRAGRSPYEGLRIKGRIRRIVLHGREVAKDGEILARKGEVL